MQLKPRSWKVDTEQGLVELTYSTFDGGDHRRSAVMAARPVLLDSAKRKFAGALRVQLSCERLSSYEVAICTIKVSRSHTIRRGNVCSGPNPAV